MLVILYPVASMILRRSDSGRPVLHIISVVFFLCEEVIFFNIEGASDSVVDVRFTHGTCHAVYGQSYLEHEYHPFIIKLYMTNLWRIIKDANASLN